MTTLEENPATARQAEDIHKIDGGPGHINLQPKIVAGYPDGDSPEIKSPISDSDMATSESLLAEETEFDSESLQLGPEPNDVKTVDLPYTEEQLQEICAKVDNLSKVIDDSISRYVELYVTYRDCFDHLDSLDPLDCSDIQRCVNEKPKDQINLMFRLLELFLQEEICTDNMQNAAKQLYITPEDTNKAGDKTEKGEGESSIDHQLLQQRIAGWIDSLKIVALNNLWEAQDWDLDPIERDSEEEDSYEVDSDDEDQGEEKMNEGDLAEYEPEDGDSSEEDSEEEDSDEKDFAGEDSHEEGFDEEDFDGEDSDSYSYYSDDTEPEDSSFFPPVFLLSFFEW